MRAGHAFIAPGGGHLELHERAGALVLTTPLNTAQDKHAPSADRLFESVARELGFYTAREKLTQDGGKIDLAIERPGRIIGCEISFMTTIDHEVGNVAKCIRAGCEHVAVICTEQSRLDKIAKAVSGCLTSTCVTCRRV